jgi:hypothetical protein
LRFCSGAQWILVLGRSHDPLPLAHRTITARNCLVRRAPAAAGSADGSTAHSFHFRNGCIAGGAGGCPHREHGDGHCSAQCAAPFTLCDSATFATSAARIEGWGSAAGLFTWAKGGVGDAAHLTGSASGTGGAADGAYGYDEEAQAAGGRDDAAAAHAIAEAFLRGPGAALPAEAIAVRGGGCSLAVRGGGGDGSLDCSLAARGGGGDGSDGGELGAAAVRKLSSVSALHGIGASVAGREGAVGGGGGERGETGQRHSLQIEFVGGDAANVKRSGGGKENKKAYQAKQAMVNKIESAVFRLGGAFGDERMPRVFALEVPYSALRAFASAFMQGEEEPAGGVAAAKACIEERLVDAKVGKRLRPLLQRFEALVQGADSGGGGGGGDEPVILYSIPSGRYDVVWLRLFRGAARVRA